MSFFLMMLILGIAAGCCCKKDEKPKCTCDYIDENGQYQFWGCYCPAGIRD